MGRILNNAEKFEAGVPFGCLPPKNPKKATRPRWDAQPATPDAPLLYVIHPGTNIQYKEDRDNCWHHYETEGYLSFADTLTKHEDYFVFERDNHYIKVERCDIFGTWINDAAGYAAALLVQLST